MGQIYNGQPCTKGMVILKFKAADLPVSELIEWLDNFSTLKGTAKVTLVKLDEGNYSDKEYVIGNSEGGVPVTVVSAKEMMQKMTKPGEIYSYCVQTDTASISGVYTPRYEHTIQQIMTSNGTLDIQDQGFNTVEVKTSYKDRVGFNMGGYTVSEVMRHLNELSAAITKEGESVISWDSFVTSYDHDGIQHVNQLVAKFSYVDNLDANASECVVTFPSGVTVVSVVEQDGVRAPESWFRWNQSDNRWEKITETVEIVKATAGISEGSNVIHKAFVGNEGGGTFKVSVSTSNTKPGNVYRLVYDPVEGSYSIWECPE